MENIAYHNSTYNITPICLDSSECSSMETLSVGCKSHLDISDNKRKLMNSGIYTPDSNSDSPNPKSDNSSSDESKSLSNSNSISFCNWADEEISLLENQIKNDLTLDTLTSRFPSKPLALIIKRIQELKPTLDWTKNEIYLLAGIILNDSSSVAKDHKDKFPCRSLSNLNKKFQYYKSMIRRLNGIDHFSKWTETEIASLFSLVDYDLTKGSLQRELPNKSIAEIRDLVNELKIHSNFSNTESVLFKEAIADNRSIESILDQFPLMDKEGCNRRLLKLNELPQHRDTARKRLEELEKLIQKEITQIKESINLTRLKHLLVTDLTRNQLRSLFPGVSMKHMKSVAKEIGFDESGEFTAAEVNFLKSALKGNTKLKAIMDELPFRGQLSIETKINEIEPDRRRTVFTSQVDELLYMAKWYSSDNFGNLSRRRNSRYASEVEKHKDQADYSKKSSELNLKKEAIEEKVEPRGTRVIRKHLDPKTREKRLKKETLDGKSKEQKLTKSKKPNSMVQVLKEESAYFQTVTGDRCVLKEGQKRKRERRPIIKPEKKLKGSKSQNSIKANGVSKSKNPVKSDVKIEKVKERKSSKSLKAGKLDRSDILIGPEIEMPSAKKNIKIEKEERKSPYDPEDISSDTLIPLYGRQLYVNAVYEDQPCPPKLLFTEDANIMIQNCSEISLTDTIAADIISQHCKNYRDMPISFPPLTIMDRNANSMILNPMNKIRIRFLLYPQHSELFILAEPKSNELDPINEIKKLFQLHYSLFFSHSSKLKKIILNEYNKEIDSSIEENDFVRFMFVIDKWNRLMVELTPNDVDIGSHDINQEIRAYFLPNEIKIPTDEDIRLDLFFSEIQLTGEENTMSDNDPIEPLSPSFDLIKCKKPRFKYSIPNRLTPPISSEEDDKENEPPTENLKDSNSINNANKGIIPCTPVKFSTRNKVVVNAVRPENYELNFFRHLREKTNVSRFCLQQILLRIYSRIVSTESRKLRSYKAFTAEVYGELLPSFTSEVLTKVNLQPHHKFYDLGSGVGNTTFQAALEFGVYLSGGCEIMEHASKLTELQTMLLKKHLSLLGLKDLPLNFALLQSFVDNDNVRQAVIECDVLLVNNYLFDVNLNTAVGRMLFGLKPGTKIISLRNFIRPRYKASGDKTIFDYLKVERHEMSNYLSVSWTANKVPYYISTVQEKICDEYI
ncbi:unnamed protein product [Debaryomyces fabryi]|nr:unnamed protein product [Debaryomyces fabryi]